MQLIREKGRTISHHFFSAICIENDTAEEAIITLMFI